VNIFYNKPRRSEIDSRGRFFLVSMGMRNI